MITANAQTPVDTLLDQLGKLNNKFALRLKHGEGWESLRPLANDIRKMVELIESRISGFQKAKTDVA